MDFRLEGPTVGPDPARERLDLVERVAESRRTDRYFDSDGVRIRFIDVGPRDGEPVVLLHGFSQRIESAWDDTGVIEALENEYRVIAPDWRGHGKSDTPHDPEAYGVAIVDDLIRLLDHLQIEKAHVVGYSMGGHITFRLLADHPDRVLSAMPCGDAGTHYPRAFDDVARRAVDSLRTSGSIRPLIEYFAAPGSMAEDQVMAIVESQRNSNDAAALAAVMQSFRNLDADPGKLAAVRVPCLAIIGEHDPFLDGLRATAATMINLQLRVMKDRDHITAFQAPECPAIIRSFIDARTGVRAASPKGPASHRDLAHDTFPEAQAELCEVVAQIARDAMTGNREGVEAVHLDTEKFTKFGLGQFNRQNYEETIESEAAWLGRASDISYEVRDLKIDVFGEVAVVTYYPVASSVLNGDRVEIGGRQTLIFLDTPDGWKIVHEHHSHGQPIAGQPAGRSRRPSGAKPATTPR